MAPNIDQMIKKAAFFLCAPCWVKKAERVRGGFAEKSGECYQVAPMVFNDN
jgi:hypothetical protein